MILPRYVKKYSFYWILNLPTYSNLNSIVKQNMSKEEDLEVEIAEEADLSLNPSLADSQSIFGDVRYR